MPDPYAAHLYTAVISREQLQGGRVLFLARCAELEGCMAHGATVTEVRAHLQEAISLTLEHLVAHGLPVPPPRRVIGGHSA